MLIISVYYDNLCIPDPAEINTIVPWYINLDQWLDNSWETWHHWDALHHPVPKDERWSGQMLNWPMFFTFSSSEAALLLVSTKKHDLWAGPTPEVRDSRTSVKSDKSDWWRIRNEYSPRAQKVGWGQRSRFLVLTKRSAASGDENVFFRKCKYWRYNQYQINFSFYFNWCPAVSTLRCNNGITSVVFALSLPS